MAKDTTGKTTPDNATDANNALPTTTPEMIGADNDMRHALTVDAVQQDATLGPAVPVAPLADPAAPLSIQNASTINQTIADAPQPPITAYPPSAYVANDAGATGVTTVSAPIVNVPVVNPFTVNPPIKVEQAAESIVVDGKSSVPLKGSPSRIDSVTVNGQALSIAVLDPANPITPAVNQVVYDVEKSALLFASDVRGLVEVAYPYVKKVEHDLLTEIVAFMHQRLLSIEAHIAKLTGSNYI